jgi:hypothetical protein
LITARTKLDIIQSIIRAYLYYKATKTPQPLKLFIDEYNSVYELNITENEVLKLMPLL